MRGLFRCFSTHAPAITMDNSSVLTNVACRKPRVATGHSGVLRVLDWILAFGNANCSVPLFQLMCYIGSWLSLPIARGLFSNLSM